MRLFSVLLADVYNMYSEHLAQQALASFDRYFSHLESTGYFRYDKVENFLGLLLADLFLNTEFSEFVTEDDYRTIENFLQCIYGRSCLTPYPEYLRQTPQIGSILPEWGGMSPFRISENSIYRTTESGDSRHTESRTEYWPTN